MENKVDAVSGSGQKGHGGFHTGLGIGKQGVGEPAAVPAGQVVEAGHLGRCRGNHGKFGGADGQSAGFHVHG